MKYATRSLFSLLVALLLATTLTLTACGGDGSATADNPSPDVVDNDIGNVEPDAVDNDIDNKLDGNVDQLLPCPPGRTRFIADDVCLLPPMPPQPCDGDLSCEAPPSDACEGNELLTSSMGVCEEGHCYYDEVAVPCPYGCLDEYSCAPDPVDDPCADYLDREGDPMECSLTAEYCLLEVYVEEGACAMKCGSALWDYTDALTFEDNGNIFYSGGDSHCWPAN